MHRNFYLFQRQITELNDQIVGKHIIDCFTHRKDEIVLQLEDGDQRFLRICINTALPYILSYLPQNIKSHRTHFFTSLAGSKISQIHCINFDKKVKISCGKFVLLCTFFGLTPNCILYDPGGNILEHFKKQVQDTSSGDANALLDPYSISIEELEKRIDQTGPTTCESFFRKHLGGFNSLLVKELIYRSAFKPDIKLKDLKTDNLESVYINLTQMMKEIAQGPALIYTRNELPARISLVKLEHLADEFHQKENASVNEAWKYFVNYYQITRRFEQVKSRSEAALIKRIGFLKNTLQQIRQSQDLEAKKKQAELKGNLLLTFAPQIRKGMTEVTLENIFSRSTQKVSIKLNPARSVSENAQIYFNKFRDISRTKEQMQIRRRTYQRELAEGEKLLQQLQNTRSIKELNKIHKTLIQRRIVQGSSARNDVDHRTKESFRHALLEASWEVFVGKNARNNDMLTFQFAGKYDLWFHAQGVSGSHVIVRSKNKNENPPEKIIHQAAQIAAYFSAAKNDSTVPVIFTQVRYVRKIRKAAPGTVNVTNSTTIFVTPKNLI